MATIFLHSGESVLIDDEHFERANQFKWYKSGNYAVRLLKTPEGRWKREYMHRFLFPDKECQHIDHIDGNGANNQTSNLRGCTEQENGCNRKMTKLNKSGYKGVSYINKMRKWYASIKHLGKSYNLGYYATPEMAYEAYKAAAVKFHGNFARL